MNTDEQNILLYQNSEGNIKLDVRLQNETVWINRQQMAILFGRDIKTIGKHINNVFDEGELEKNATVAKFATVQSEGEREVERLIEYYNLDVIISAGTVSHQQALEKAKAEYEKYRKVEDERFISDFDREMKKLEQTFKQKK